MSRSPLILLLLLVTTAPVHAQGKFPPDSFTNLKVLPRGIQRDSLVALMASFTRALGVRCTYCHVGEEGRPLETYDFAADDKAAKKKARTMLEMVARVNQDHLVSLTERANPPVRVQCFTCHHGVREPRTLQDVLRVAYQAAGADSAVAAYTSLRTRFYGRAAYDFGEVALADLADLANASGHLADAERFHELNVQNNPRSVFARSALARVALTRAFAEQGADSGSARYASLKARFGGAPFAEALLNSVGYALLRQRKNAEAVAAFQINAREFPQSPNVYDSLGEAFVASGNVQQAIRSYERALQLDPGNTSAAARLKALRGGRNQ